MLDRKEGDDRGLLRLVFGLHEPANYKLSSASIRLDFQPLNTGCSPTVTKYIFPDILVGPPLSRQISQSHGFEPTVEILGQSVSGISLSRNAEYSKVSRWHLRGSRLPNEENYYTTASWTWQANKANKENEMIPSFHLAMILEHPEPSMKVTVAIEGELRQGQWRRWKYNSSKGLPNTVPFRIHQCGVELEPIISELSKEMIRLNTAPIPRKYLFFFRAM